MNILFLGDFYYKKSSNISIGTDLKNILSKHEYISVVLEGALDSHGINSATKIGPAISQDSCGLKFLKNVSKNFNILNLANNHIMDYGKNGLDRTIKFAMNNNFYTAGAGLTFDQAYSPIIIERDGVSVAILNLCEAQFGFYYSKSSEGGGMAWVNHSAVNNMIMSLKKKYNYLIVQVHAGLEMCDVPLPGWRKRYKELIDLGADLIVGHHPHVRQGNEVHNGKNIFYSIGNFYMDIKSGDDRFNQGFALSVEISNNGLSNEIYPFSNKLNVIEVDSENNLLELLTHKINNNEFYNKYLDNIADKFWSKYFKYYIYEACSIYYFNKNISILKNIIIFIVKIKKHILKDGINYSFMEHNLIIESNRWIIERYLLSRKK